MPESEERVARGLRQWWVKKKLFVWERPLRKADLAELGDDAPAGPVLAVRVPDVGARDALIADSPGVYFTTSHFDGFPAVLVRLDEIEVGELGEVLDEAWTCRAPRRLVAQHRPED